ncbi:MAG TPA: glycosyltransferase [Segetibacter sp.]|nr:glycosyltransferase [Segetibacter sp.]
MSATLNNIAEKTVSVVMCTYNGEAFVEEQLKSILSQTYPVYELLIFDDASTDNTQKIITRAAFIHPLIKVVLNEKNVGFTKNFEQAIKAATGDVIAISDQDDIWVNTKIEKMMKAWNPASPLIYCSSFIFADNPPTNPLPPKFRQFEGNDARKIFLFNTISGHALLFKKEFVPLVLPFKEGVMYDWWMGVVAAYNGGVQHYNDLLVFHRSHKNNITVNTRNKYKESEQRYLHKKLLIEHTQKFVTAPNIPASHKDFLIKYHALLKESLSKTFHFPLFLFMLRNRHLFFSYKRKTVSFISHIKHSYLRTYNPKMKSNFEHSVIK